MAKKPTRVRRTFTPQFKKDAVRLVHEGRSVTDVARALGVARSLLQRWKEQLEADSVKPFPGKGNVSCNAKLGGRQSESGVKGRDEDFGMGGIIW